MHCFSEPLDTDEGWAKDNVHYWLRDYARLPASSSSGACFTEPHSTKQIEDCVGWGLETDPETLADTDAGAARACSAEALPRRCARACAAPCW